MPHQMQKNKNVKKWLIKFWKPELSFICKIELWYLNYDKNYEKKSPLALLYTAMTF
jgi:hypothetical protein